MRLSAFYQRKRCSMPAAWRSRAICQLQESAENPAIPNRRQFGNPARRDAPARRQRELASGTPLDGGCVPFPHAKPNHSNDDEQHYVAQQPIAKGKPGQSDPATVIRCSLTIEIHRAAISNLCKVDQQRLIVLRRYGHGPCAVFLEHSVPCGGPCFQW